MNTLRGVLAICVSSIIFAPTVSSAGGAFSSSSDGSKQDPAAQAQPAAPEPAASPAQAPAVLSKSNDRVEFRLLATKKTSTMQKELNEAADGGFRFLGVMGGGTTFGGHEVVSIMAKLTDNDSKTGYEYKLLATNKTSTMQKEMQEAGDAGFEFKGQTVFESTFGGDEVVVILERNRDAKTVRYEYRLLATKKTGTMQKELQESGDQGFEYVGVTVSKTAFGGTEVVTILRRPVLE